MDPYDLLRSYEFIVYGFVMYVEASTVAIIALAVAQGVVKALEVLGKAGVVKIPELEKK
ncbi:MAG: hypothetical protein QXW41_08105 [Fervidicoccaceae archaeon]